MSQKVRLEGDALLAGLRQGRVGVWRWPVGTDQVLWTDNLEALHDLPEGAFNGTLSSFQNDLHTEDRARVWHAIDETVGSGSPYRVRYRSAAHLGGDDLWIEACGGLVEGEDGQRYLTGVCLDVTEVVRAERELARRLAQQEAIQALSSYALEEHSLNEIMDRTVETAAAIFDVPMAKVLRFMDSADELFLVSGVGWQEGLVGHAMVGVDQESQAGYTLTSVAPVIVHDLLSEKRFSGPPLLHEHGVRSGMSVVIAGDRGRPFGVFGVHSTHVRTFDQNDIDALISIANIVAQSARQEVVREQQQLLLREMAHRSGNLLQVVASIATQTFKTQLNPQAALQSFAARLDSLARANHLISRGGWAPTRLVSLVQEILGVYGDRIAATGRDVRLPASLAFDLGLVLHELATNSAKYGSLSTGSGRVRLSWRIEGHADDRALICIWEDSEKHTAHAPGTGFGSKLKRSLIERKWSGTIEIDTEGPYRCTFRIPLNFDASTQ